MKRILSIFSLTLATVVLMFSIVETHHHHFHQICFGGWELSCEGDEDEPHSSSPDEGNDNCPLEQLQFFTINQGGLHHISTPQILNLLSSAVISDPIHIAAPVSTISYETGSDIFEYYTSAFHSGISRRGPPSIITL
jgi:hypothetical protein